MSDKQIVIDAVRKLPEDARLDDIVANLELLARIREGHADADAGRVVSHEQVKREFRSWITN
jgi:predicted transcriptional regulator